MNNIIVDNWFMTEVAGDISQNRIQESKAYSDLLSAIVLWEEVFYPKNSRNWWNQYPELKDRLHPVENVDFGSVDYLFYHGTDGLGHVKDQYRPRMKDELVVKGALHYMMLSSHYNCDYLPCSDRQAYLFKDEVSSEIISSAMSTLSRIERMGVLDKSIRQYYEEIYKKLFSVSQNHIKMPEFKMPILVNYIFDKCEGEMLPIDYAFHLRNEGPVVQYREYLSRVQESFESQKLDELNYLLHCSDDAVSDVMSINKSIGYIDVSIFPLPSILFNLKDVHGSISASPSLGIKHNFNKPRKHVQLTFLRDLTHYAIHEMKV